MILRTRSAVFTLGLALGAASGAWVVSAATGHTRVAAPEPSSIRDRSTIPVAAFQGPTSCRRVTNINSAPLSP